VDHQKETAPIPIAVIGGIAGLGLPWRSRAKAWFAIFSSLHLLLVNLKAAVSRYDPYHPYMPSGPRDRPAARFILARIQRG